MQQTLKRRDEDHQKEEAELSIVWDCGSPLYDSYELVTVSHQIERHLMALPYLGGSRRFITNLSHDPSSEMASLSTTISSSDVRSGISTGEGKGSSSSSMVGCLSGFVGIRKIWKRRVVFGGRKDKTKKMKTGLSGFCNLIGLRRQKDQDR